MSYQFTPAAERALSAASRWTAPARRRIEPQALLMGLLDEPECRAATMLARHGVDPAGVRQRWPDLTETNHRNGQAILSVEVEVSLSLAAERMPDDPLVLATEHLLLGLVMGDDETSQWLVERGFDADALESEIHRLHGHELEPIEMGNEEWGMGNEEKPKQAPRASPPTTPHSPFLIPHSSSFRILDAAANRCREGLRVVEDYVRFALDDRHLTEQLKQLRHDVTSALATLPQHELLACRDTQHDVGTAVTTASEAHRPNPKSVVTAGFKRVQEALRSLEEFGKLLDPQLAQRFEQMRYRTYTLERAVGTTRDARTQLASSRLYVLLDALGSLDEFKRVADELVAAGVDVIQLRAKNVSDRVLVERGKALRAATAGSRTLYVMNDRADLAVLTQADGVHVGQDELSVFEVRHIAGPAMLIGVSTHTIEQARQAVLDGANYLGVGPVFPSGTKSFERLAGLDLVRAVAAEIALPAFAIGGISSENVDSVLAAGLGRVAVSGAILFAADRTAACRGLLRLLAVRDTES